MVDRRLSPRLFDNDKTLVSTRHQPIGGEQHAPGDEISDELGKGVRMRLWLSGRAEYEDSRTPTPVADTPDADPPAPPIEGDENDTLTVGEFTAKQNGAWWTITGPGLEEPAKAQGEGNARAKLEELNEAHSDEQTEEEPVEEEVAEEAAPVEEAAEEESEDGDDAAE